MKFKAAFIALITVYIFSLFCLPLAAEVTAAEITPSLYETQVFDLIIKARTKHLETAESTDSPSLLYNGNVYLAASDRSLDIFEDGLQVNGVWGSLAVADQLRERGYIPSKTGEAVASLVFSNYISPGDAAKTLFNKILADELKLQIEEDRNILNPDFEDVGVSLRSGKVKLGGRWYNSYLLVLDFATSVMSCREMELMELVNQAREIPMSVAVSLGMDSDKIVEDLPVLEDILTNGLPPFSFNESLYAAATAHGLDMLENNYYSYVSLDGSAVDDRISREGYLPVFSDELLGCLTSAGYMEPADIARMLFEANFKAELKPENEDRIILNPELKDAGTSFTVRAVDNGDGLYTTQHLLVADCAAREEQAGLFLTGLVFEDLDGDALFDPGEGLAGIQITIQGDSGKIDCFTNSAGGFAVQREPGTYSVNAYLPEGSSEQEVTIEEQNVRVRFVVEVEEEEEG